jgi:hypothetical protein
MIPFRATMLAALVLLAGPVLAQAADKTGKPPAANGICSAEQLAQIDDAFVEAHTAIRFTLERLAAEPGHAELRRWFGTTPGKLVRANLQRVAARVAQGRPSDVACNHPGVCRNQFAAYARPGTGALGFCQAFFSAGSRGQDSRFGIIVHEVSHISIGTVDATYQPRQVLILAKDDPAAAARNADSYEYLVESLYR